MPDTTTRYRCLKCGWMGEKPGFSHSRGPTQWLVCPKYDCGNPVEDTRLQAERDYGGYGPAYDYPHTSEFGRLKQRIDETMADYQKPNYEANAKSYAQDLIIILANLVNYYGPRCECSCKDKGTGSSD